MLSRTRRLSPGWHGSRQRDRLLPAVPQAREVSLPPTRTNAHSSQATCEKEITQGFTISSFTLYPVPSTLQLFMACFCVAVGRNRTMWVPSRAAASSPACWGARQSLVCFWLIPQARISVDTAEMLLFPL